MDHQHEWERTGHGTHFIDEPNSRRRSRPVVKVLCPCGQRGFRYDFSRVVYTWDCNEENWET